MRRILPTLLFLGLLLIVALRLTMTESLDSSAGTQAAAIQSEGVQPGPGVTVGCAILTLLIAGGACLLVPLRRIHYAVLGFIAAILVCAAVSAARAAAPFVALIGTFDLATGLLAGFASLLLCNQLARRQLLLGMLAAVLAAAVAKAANQRFVEIPETIQYYQEHKSEVWASYGWKAGDPNIALFEARMNSRELTGYLTLSNVFAASLLPLVLAAVAVALQAVLEGRAADENKNPSPAREAENPSHRARSNAGRSHPGERAKRPDTPPPDPGIRYVLAVLLFLLAAAGLAVLLATGSKGATAAGLAALALFIAGYFGRAFLVAHRRSLTLAGLALILLSGGAVVGYGLTHHGLPSRSLLFRWQYWTGAAPIIRDHPLLGVGLNNFGSYYPQYKLPSAPEDVKDPHNPFVRLAAEAGLPAAAFLAGLVLLLVLRPLWKPMGNLPSTPSDSSELPPCEEQDGLALPAAGLLGAAWCAAWWTLHRVLAEPAPAYFTLWSILMAAATGAAFFIVIALLAGLPARVTQRAIMAAFVGALAVLLYDQINTALVTGPVSMLFWLVLGAANASDLAVPKPLIKGDPNAPPAPWAQHLVGTLLLLAGAGGAIAVWPSAVQGTWPTDPEPYENAALVAWQTRDYATALRDIDAALARNPRSTSLLRKRIEILERLHRPTGVDIERLLALRPADAPLHLELATLESDLPPTRRVALLRRALWLNEQLAPDEPRRFSPQDLARLHALLARLESPASAPAP